jgi:hypothetical protein
MKLVATMMCAKVETDRYLHAAVAHALGYCDEIVLTFDGVKPRPENDWTLGLTWGDDDVRVISHWSHVGFFEHEGRCRQQGLDVAMERDPTHILAIDADEFVSDGTLLRMNVQARPEVATWSLCMQEVWKADADGLTLRSDGQWVERDVPILYRPDSIPKALLQMPDKALASGRTPVRLSQPRAHTCTAILHFGWTRLEERQRRYDRYVQHDGGRFHASAHLDSIMWPDSRLRFTGRDWPASLLPVKDRVLSYAAPDLTPA